MAWAPDGIPPTRLLNIFKHQTPPEGTFDVNPQKPEDSGLRLQSPQAPPALVRSQVDPLLTTSHSMGTGAACNLLNHKDPGKAEGMPVSSCLPFVS